MALCHTVF